jgi:hypothetical protein
MLGLDGEQPVRRLGEGTGAQPNLPRLQRVVQISDHRVALMPDDLGVEQLVELGESVPVARAAGLLHL